MNNYRISVSSYVEIEARTQEEAARELEARQETIGKSNSIEEDLLLNATIDSVAIDDNE